MVNKVLLVLVDGMRPDGLEEIPFVQNLKRQSTYTMDAQVVMPSITLPCHMSLFHSVPAERHGVTDNIYTPMARPLEGLCERLVHSQKQNAFFYSWEPLRDLARPDSLAHAAFVSGAYFTYEKANVELTTKAIAYIQENTPDFVFLYLGFVDDAGHRFGWMSPEYKRAVAQSWEQIERIMTILPSDYTTIITADHGGHDRMHGIEVPEDMTIPIFFRGEAFISGKEIHNVSIMDIAPTITDIMGVAPAREWEGKSIC